MDRRKDALPGAVVPTLVERALAEMQDRWLAAHPEFIGGDVAAATAALQQHLFLALALAMQREGPEVAGARDAKAAVARCVAEIRAAGGDVAALEAALAEREARLLTFMVWGMATGFAELLGPSVPVTADREPM